MTKHFYSTYSPGNVGSVHCAAWVRSKTPSLCTGAGFQSRVTHLRRHRHRFARDRRFSELISSPQLLKSADKKKSNSWQDQQHCEHLLDRDSVPMGKQLPSKKKLQEDPMLISFMGWYKRKVSQRLLVFLPFQSTFSQVGAAAPLS